MDGKKVRDFLLILRCVLEQKRISEMMTGVDTNSKDGPDCFLHEEEAALEEAIFCVEQVHGLGNKIGAPGFYQIRKKGELFKTRMDILMGENRMRHLKTIYMSHGGGENGFQEMIEEAIRCMEIIHKDELGKDFLYKTFEQVE